MVDRVHRRLWITDVVFLRRVVAAAARCRHLGREHSGRVGIRDREFRLVDRHRPRRHVHLRDFAFAVSALAHRHQSFRRSDDALRCRLRRVFPLLHLGRPWVFYWLLPYPDTMGLWPQFRSPLVWDVFAVGTYFTVSVLFWFLGLVPDLATVRDRANESVAEKILRRARARLAQFRRALATASDRLSASRRTGHAARAFGAQRR